MSGGEPSHAMASALNPASLGAGAVFLSYASQDANLADQVCAALEAAGFPCRIAPRDVRPGAPYAAAIVEAINACRLMVLLLTKTATESPHVLREVERASSKKRPVLSIRLDAAEAFRAATVLDPGYASAWAGLADASYWIADAADNQGWYSSKSSRRRARP
jgi:hypothetical protein